MTDLKDNKIYGTFFPIIKNDSLILVFVYNISLKKHIFSNYFEFKILIKIRKMHKGKIQSKFSD